MTAALSAVSNRSRRRVTRSMKRRSRPCAIDRGLLPDVRANLSNTFRFELNASIRE
jgi:hypothetical protein